MLQFLHLALSSNKPQAITGQERGQIARLANGFSNPAVPALSIAIARNGQFVYDQSFGMIDRQKLQVAQETSLFRIASLTKPITAVAIFTLIEKGQLNLNDKVFGSSGVLGTKYGKGPYKQYVTDITVDHLLTHTSGGGPTIPPIPCSGRTPGTKPS